jgi:hypothetical protein
MPAPSALDAAASPDAPVDGAGTIVETDGGDGGKDAASDAADASEDALYEDASDAGSD